MRQLREAGVKPNPSRGLLVVALSMMLAACAENEPLHPAMNDGGYRLPPVSGEGLDKKFVRQVVDYKCSAKPGALFVDTKDKFLYLAMPGCKAMRYGIAVGDEAHSWRGRTKVSMKREWPVWTPTPEMIRGTPQLAKYTSGLRPGVVNPLGARAIYLANAKGDTGFRIHGTPEWTSIGRAKSSGCIRLINQDVIDLYDRVAVGADVIVD